MKTTPLLLVAAIVAACIPADDSTPPQSDPIQEMGLREGDSPTADSPGWVKPSKVVVVNLWPDQTESLAEVAPGVELVFVENAAAVVEHLNGADAVLGALDASIVNSGQSLRWVQLSSAGVERFLAIPGLRESDITITNAQRIFATGGAEHVIGMMFMLSRRLHTALQLQKAHEWNITPLTGPNPYSGAGSELMEMRGRTMLVVGLGGIGTEVARIAHGIGMRVTATRNSSREGPDYVDYVGLSSELHELATEADVIVNSVPLTPATEGMFDRAFFAKTKPTAFFINIGRGKTVDQEAMIEALKSGRLAGAGLDVTEPEPLPAGHELWDLPNVIITPHIGGDSEQHMNRMFLVFRENLRRFVAGEKLLSVVDISRGY
jgi:phosphoglycerate dehydrogenase-like enzyme